MVLFNSIPRPIDVVGQSDGMAMEDDDKDECGLSSGEPEARREEPLGSVNGEQEAHDKENNNGRSTAESQAVRYDERNASVASLEKHHLFRISLKTLSSMSVRSGLELRRADAPLASSCLV